MVGLSHWRVIALLQKNEDKHLKFQSFISRRLIRGLIIARNIRDSYSSKNNNFNKKKRKFAPEKEIPLDQRVSLCNH